MPQDDPALAAESSALYALLDPLISTISRACRPLFVKPPGRVPRQVGCCILIELCGTRFFFTAAHVMDHFIGQPLLIGSNEHLVEVPGRAERNLPVEGSARKADQIDAAVFRVQAGELEEIAGCFLSIEECDSLEASTAEDDYLIFGYPASKTRLRPETRNVAPDLFRYAGPGLLEESYSPLSLSPVTHVGMAFNHRRAATPIGVRTPPALEGMSGTGIWRITLLPGHPRTAGARLVAIFTDHRRGEQLLLGTRIMYHLELVRHGWPGFRKLLAPSHLGIRFSSTDRDC